MLVVADATQTLMKIRFSNDMKSDENSYLLNDAINSIEKIEVMVDDDDDDDESVHQIILQIVLINEQILWILYSTGILYEYNFHTKQYSIIKDSTQICYCSVV